ncbi:peptidoglycan-binding domain-containing protein [Haloechinothrix salitolerans]|uniref:Peptidoglycan-binding domain-containing protein n=1 Tax=Haloechinothrix salitolerans TaxID=926830 RepID=A0ABW2BVI7_9PSEU
MNEVYPLYSQLRVDGIYRPKTQRVMREFQRRSGLVPDGIVGPKTWAALGI